MRAQITIHRWLLLAVAAVLLAAAALSLTAQTASATGHTNVNPGVRPFVALLDASDDPVAPDQSGNYRISPVSGVATTLNLRVYMVKAARSSLPAAADYALYGDFSYVYMGIASGTGVWPKLTGATWSDTSLCGDQTGLYGAGGEDCNMLKTKWINNAMAADSTLTASDTEAGDPVHPLDFTITVPAGTASFTFASLTDCRSDGTNCSHNGNPDNNDAANNRIRNQATQIFSDGGFQAHIYRYQPAFYARNADGSINWGDVSTSMTATHTVRSAQLCTQAHMTVGDPAYVAASDCNRAVKIGEAIYLPNTLLQQSGAARNGNFWLDATGGSRVTYGQFDTVTVSVPAGQGFVGAGTFCPVDVAIHSGGVESLWTPRDRTAAALASCTWDGAAINHADTTLWNGDGALFFPTAAGTVTATVSFAKSDDPATAWDDSFSATDTIDIVVTATGAEPIKAYMGRRRLDNALSLLIGRKYTDGLPSQWGFGPVTEPGGEGYVAGATYADVDETEAIVLTVPAGTLQLLGQSGTIKSCTAERGACKLTISRADLKAAARAGWTGSTATPIEDTAHIYLAKLRYSHASGASEGVQISGVLKLNDGNTENFSYTAPAAAASAPAVAGYPRGDADRLLAPGQTAAVSVGYHLPADGTSAPWRLFRPTPEIWAVSRYDGPALNSRLRVVQEHAVRSEPLPATLDGAYLQITGPASWADNGGRRLSLDRAYGGKTYGHFTCIDSKLVESNADAGSSTCFITDGAGVAPSLTVDADAAEDVVVTARLPLWTLGSEESAPGAASGMPLGTEAHRDSVWHQRLEVFGTATFRVEAVSQLASITLGREPVNDVVPTSPIRIGGSASVLLALLNENGMPSQLSSVSAITVTVVGGGTLGGDYCSGAASCTISASRGSPLFNAAAADPTVIGKIALTYNAPDAPGEAAIDVAVVGTDGSTFAANLALTISGSATEIASSGEMPRVHSSATEDDDRDKVLLPISASDANGNAARMPTNAAATVRGIDGATVPSSSLTSEVKCTDGEARLRCNVESVVTATAASPLASGAYTATVTGSGIGSAEIGFAVGGPAETVTIGLPDELPGLAGSFTATASLIDMAGVPVADGTWVTFRTTAASSGTASAIVSRPPLSDHDENPDTDAVRRTKTKNGVAEATVTVVGNGIAILTATAGDKSANEPIDTRVTVAEESAAGPPVRFETPDESAATGTLATWTSTAAGDAREALEQVSDASIVWLWNGVEWIRWGTTADGNPIPGSSETPFVILSGDRLWFAN